MTTQPEPKKRPLKKILGEWIYRALARPGWTRRIALAAAAALFALSALYLTGTSDYREDPSALVPRSADVFAETRDLPLLLKTAGAWRIWRPERRGDGAEARSELERDLAGLVSARVGGLPLGAPLRWMAAARGAAFCVSRGSGEEEGGGEASWALYLLLGDPASALREIEIEPGMTLTVVQGGRDTDGVFSLAGRDGTAALGIVGPWLIFSGDEKLPAFALEAKRRPSLSLAGAGVLPHWSRSAGLRGLVNPSSAAARRSAFGPAFADEWLAPGARLAYTAVLGKNGGVETRLASVELTDAAPGAALGPVVFLLMAVLAVASLAVIFAILLVMVGWGGWLKALALRGGIAPAPAPERVEPSRAFREDSGGDAGGVDEHVETDEQGADTSKSSY